MLDRSCENSELAKSSQAPIFPDASLRSASQSELDRKLSNWRTRGRRASVQVAIRAIPKGGRSSGPTGKLARVSLTRRSRSRLFALSARRTTTGPVETHRGRRRLSLTRRRNRDGTRVKRKSALYVLNGPNSKRRCERGDVKIMRFAGPGAAGPGAERSPKLFRSGPRTEKSATTRRKRVSSRAVLPLPASAPPCLGVLQPLTHQRRSKRRVHRGHRGQARRHGAPPPSRYGA